MPSRARQSIRPPLALWLAMAAVVVLFGIIWAAVTVAVGSRVTAPSAGKLVDQPQSSTMQEVDGRHRRRWPDEMAVRVLHADTYSRAIPGERDTDGPRSGVPDGVADQLGDQEFRGVDHVLGALLGRAQPGADTAPGLRGRLSRGGG